MNPVETGFYYLQSRYYDAGTCRFINADDTSILGLTGGTDLGANLFAYCNNNSINNTDHTGYIAANIAGAVIGAIIGIVGGAFLGKWLAEKIGLSGWKKLVFVGVVSTLAGASLSFIGNFIGPYMAKLGQSIMKGLRCLFGPKIGIKVGKLGKLIKNTKPIITGLTEHGLMRMEQRGISKALAQEIVNKGYAVSQAGGKVLYFTKAGVVVLSQEGKVITAYSSRYFDDAMKGIIELFFS